MPCPSCLQEKKKGIFPAGMVDLCLSPTSPRECSGKSQCAVLEGLSCDGSMGRKNVGENVQETPGEGNLMGICSWTVIPLLLSPASLPQGIQDGIICSSPIRPLKHFPFFCDPEPPSGAFPCGNGAGQSCSPWNSGSFSPGSVPGRRAAPLHPGGGGRAPQPHALHRDGHAAARRRRDGVEGICQVRMHHKEKHPIPKYPRGEAASGNKRRFWWC